jgi:hypothetical protein
MSGAGRLSCPLCREVYALNKKKPVCGKCWPGLHEMNRTAFDLWQILQGQWRFSYGGPVALDLTAIEAALRLHNIPEADRAFVAEQLLAIGSVVLAEWRKEDEFKNMQTSQGKTH